MTLRRRLRHVAAIIIVAGATSIAPVALAPQADAAQICWTTNGAGSDWTGGCYNSSLSCADWGMESGASEQDSSGSSSCYDHLVVSNETPRHLQLTAPQH